MDMLPYRRDARFCFADLVAIKRSVTFDNLPLAAAQQHVLLVDRSIGEMQLGLDRAAQLNNARV